MLPSSSTGPWIRHRYWPWLLHGNICIPTMLEKTEAWKENPYPLFQIQHLSHPSSDEIDASIEQLHAKMDAAPPPKTTRKTKNKPSKRDSTIFAAIHLGLKGMKYCSFLKDNDVNPKWSESSHPNYCAGYQAGMPWRKKIRDEKSRARARMENYTDPILADAFNFHLPTKFHELSSLLNSRNSRPASKGSVSPKPRKR